MGSFVIWAVLAMAVFWAVGAYNRLVKLRAVAIRHSQTLSTHWVQYVEWLHVQLPPNNPASVFASSVIATPDDEPSWLAIEEALGPAKRCLQQLQNKPLDEQCQAMATHAIEQLDAMWQPLMNQEPDLAGAAVPEHTHQQWRTHHVQRLTAVSDYNLAVQAYHRAVGHLPEIWLARLARLETLSEIHLAA